MRIDAHVTLWNEPPGALRAHPHFPGEDRTYLPQHLLPILARNRFDRAILCAADGGEEECVRYTEWCDAHPEFAGFLAPWHPSMKPIRHLLGITVCLTGPEHQHLREALEFCVTHHLALEVLPPVSEAAIYPSLVGTASQFPGVDIVLAHLAGPPEEKALLAQWMDTVRTLAALPNVHCKLSAMWSGPVGSWLLTDKQALFAFLLDAFSPGRLLFGSDWPFCLPARSWKECMAAFTQSLGAQPMEIREQILGETARRIYRLAP